jgi:hypothetical protein
LFFGDQFGLGAGSVETLTVQGPENQNIYTADLYPGNAGGNESFAIDAQSTGNIHVYMGDDNGNSVTDSGSGHDTIVLGNGNGDRVQTAASAEVTIKMGDGYNDGVTAYGSYNKIFLGNGEANCVLLYGNDDSATLGTGTGDGAQIGSGLTNVAVTILGADATMQDGALGTNEVLTDKAGGSTFTIGLANSETIHLGGSANNIINVQGDPLNNATIDGVSKTDIFHFTDGFANATITTASGDTTVHFASGQTVTLTGTHDAATFGADPSIHYI